LCQTGWKGKNCETPINYCENVTCLNNGICRPLFVDYKCECLGTDYSGRFCQNIGKELIIRQIICKSFGYIAILCIVFLISFFVIMDILKYCFGIDPTKNELEKIRKRRRAKKRSNHQPIIQKFHHVNAPQQQQSSTNEEANV